MRFNTFAIFTLIIATTLCGSVRKLYTAPTGPAPAPIPVSKASVATTASKAPVATTTVAKAPATTTTTVAKAPVTTTTVAKTPVTTAPTTTVSKTPVATTTTPTTTVVPSTPAPSTQTVVTSGAKINGPVKAIYIDWKGYDASNPTVGIKQAVDAGYNLIVLAFYIQTGPADMAENWGNLQDSVKLDTIKYAHSKGAKIIVSIGGETESPYSNNATAYGINIATWANANRLDGVDFDLENFGGHLVAGSLTDVQTVQWIADATNAARSVLGNDKIITHAPQAPYFGPIGGAGFWAGPTGGYTGVYKQAPSIDYFLVQFYNQGANCYVNYESLFLDSNGCDWSQGTSVKEIASYGIPMEKIVVGKIVTQSDGGSGWISAANFAQFVKRAQTELGWNAGIMGWQWAGSSTSSWVQTLYPNSGAISVRRLLAQRK